MFKAIVENVHTDDKKKHILCHCMEHYVQQLSVAGGSFKSLLVSHCRFHVLLDV